MVMDEKRGRTKRRKRDVVMETRQQVEKKPEVEQPKNTGEYYVSPTRNTTLPTKSHTTQWDEEEHKYHNDTLNGKASLLYEVGVWRESEGQSISNKLQRGLKLSEVRVVNGKKLQHVSKNWKKETEDFSVWRVCWKQGKLQ